MLKVTESAIANLKEYFEANHTNSAVRVIMRSSCSGTNLALGLDEKKNTDKVYEEGGLTFLVESALFATTGAIEIDFITPTSSCGCGGSGGFVVNSEKKLGGSSCSTGSCSSGACGC